MAAHRGVVLLLSVLLAACGPGPSSGSKGKPSPKPSPRFEVAEGYEDYRACDGTRTAVAPRLSLVCPKGWYVNPAEAQEDEGSLLNRLESKAEGEYRDTNDFYAPYPDEWSITAIVRPPQYRNVDDALTHQCREGETTHEVYECKKIEINGVTFTWVLGYHSNDGNCYCRFALTQRNGLEFDLSGGPGTIDRDAQKQGLKDIETILMTAHIE